MKKRRFFFLGIIVVGFLILALSISGFLEHTTYVKERRATHVNKTVDENSKREQRLTLEPNSKDITQEIYDLYLQDYDKEGREISVIRGAYAILIKNRLYKVTRPEIEFSSTVVKSDNRPRNIFITSDFGDIDETANKVFLYENVIIKLEDFNVYTDDLKYLPDEKIIATDNLVTIKGKDMKITGYGFEISLSDSKALIKKEPVMEINGDLSASSYAQAGRSIFSPKSKANGSYNKSQDPITHKNSAEKIIIRASGELVFENKNNHAIFHDNVRISRGNANVFADKLTLPFGAEMKTIKEAIASGNVLASDGEKTAKGTRLVWTYSRTYIDLLQSLLRSSAGNYTRIYIDLYGNPLASVKDGERHIFAPKISFSENENKILVNGRGNILVKSHTKKGEDSQLIDINWDEKMIYDGKNKTASFYGKVKVAKGEENLGCDRLDALFHNKDEIKKISASGNVYIASPGLENTEGLGTSLIWDLSEDLAVLMGDPLAELRRSGARTFSEKIYFDINAKRIHFEGKSQRQVY
jgi:LPS export ABC transporter protein LptC/lipopolysaccharide transport protein LptA